MVLISDGQHIPSIDALKLHCKGVLWTSHLWESCRNDVVTLLPLDSYGWCVDNTSGEVNCVWHCTENLLEVRERRKLLSNGCKCGTGIKGKTNSVCVNKATKMADVAAYYANANLVIIELIITLMQRLYL